MRRARPLWHPSGAGAPLATGWRPAQPGLRRTAGRRPAVPDAVIDGLGTATAVVLGQAHVTRHPGRTA